MKVHLCVISMQNCMKRYLLSIKNGGLSSARNAGILIAEGEYIIFPDPDDWVEKDYLSTLYEMQSYYNADLTCVGYILDFENGNSIPGTDGELSLFDRNEAKTFDDRAKYERVCLE